MKHIVFLIISFLFVEGLFAQQQNCSMIITPKAQKAKAKPRRGDTPVTPTVSHIEAFICFEDSTAFYNDEALDVLDSLYSLVFAKNNSKFYKMTIIGYDDAKPLTEKTTTLARERAVLVFNYFLSREDVKDFIIKRTPSKYISSCSGEVDYFIKYKMPIDFKWVTLNGKPEAEQSINGISLKGKAYILIEDDLEGCVGAFYNYYYPQQDTSFNGQYSMITIPQGALESITNTKDTFDVNYNITYSEVFNFNELMENYHFIPAAKQYLINAGYIIVNTDHKPDYASCQLRDEIKPSIKIKVAVTPEQANAQMKFFAKSFKADGSYIYKAIPTKKEKVSNSSDIYLTTEITPFQMDTIYLGKRVTEDELSNYFYPAQQTDPGSFEAMGGWLKTYKLNKRGAYVIKKPMNAMLKKPVGEVEVD
ncbi:MAG: hypothetical protein LBO06_01410 [Bacteroidales bacterium]|nr:hypothetical protein [Bacteroidales bacterium]